MPEFSSSQKFFASLLVLILAFLLDSKLEYLLGWRPDIVFAALIIFAFFLGFLELLFLVGLSFMVLNWQPIFSIEMALFIVFPMTLFFFRRIVFALEGWLSSILAVIIATFAFYSLSNFALTFKEPEILFGDIFLCAAFGFLIFEFFGYFYKESGISPSSTV